MKVIVAVPVFVVVVVVVDDPTRKKMERSNF